MNESVKLAKQYGHEASSKFVNAILRKIEKNEMEKLLAYIATKPILEDEIISIVTSHPLWMVDELLKEYDKKFVTEFLNANNITPEITLRSNRLKTTRDELYKLLILRKIDCRKGKKMTDFKGKLFTVQDEAAQLACLKLAAKPDEIVLDACSAPGGKTTYLAEIMENKGEVEAWDIHPHRVRLVEEAAKKLDISIIHAKVHDATISMPSYKEKFDKILLDVPCSGLGVIRKKPDIKWTRKIEDFEELMSVQEKILDTCSEYLKPGGRMVYSTCTVLKRENEEQIDRFLLTHSDFTLVEQVKLFPNVDETDGFYIAVLERK